LLIDNQISVGKHHPFVVSGCKSAAHRVDVHAFVVYVDPVCHEPDRAFVHDKSHFEHVDYHAYDHIDRTCPDASYDKAYAWHRVFRHVYHILYGHIPYANDRDDICHSVSDPDDQNILCHGDCNDVYGHDALPTDDYEHTSTHVADDGLVEYGVAVFLPLTSHDGYGGNDKAVGEYRNKHGVQGNNDIQTLPLLVVDNHNHLHDERYVRYSRLIRIN